MFCIPHSHHLDINECEISDPCDGIFEECVNTSPGYNCICGGGYAGNGNGVCVGEFGDMCI